MVVNSKQYFSKEINRLGWLGTWEIVPLCCARSKLKGRATWMEYSKYTKESQVFTSVDVRNLSLILKNGVKLHGLQTKIINNISPILPFWLQRTCFRNRRVRRWRSKSAWPKSAAAEESGSLKERWRGTVWAGCAVLHCPESSPLWKRQW